MSEYGVDMQKWARLSIFEQMGNVGSEVGRAFSAIRRKDDVSLEAALYRGLGLLDATANIWATKQASKTKEVLRAREVFAQAVVDHRVDDSLEDYFMQYALAARMQK